jgi:hypothetical protein
MNRILTALLSTGVFALWNTEHRITSDGLYRWNALTALLDHGQLSAERYSLAGPLFATPLYYLGKLAGYPIQVGSCFNALYFTLGLIGLLRLLKPVIGARTSLTFGILCVFASMFTFHVGNFYGEIFTAVNLALGTILLVQDRRFAGWAFLTLAVVNTPAALIALGFVAAMEAYRTRRLSPIFMPLISVALILAENQIRRGSWTNGGYEGDKGFATILPYSGREGFSYPLVLGALSLLFSFGKGLLFFTPGIFTPLFKPDLLGNQNEHENWILRYWLVAALGLLLVYSKWFAWYGGVYWGPRFMLFACFPASLLLARLLDKKLSPNGSLAVICVTGWAFWVGLDGLILGLHDSGACYADHYALELLCWYTPEFSPLLRPFVSPRALGTKEILLACLWAGTFLCLMKDQLGSLFKVQTSRMRRQT